MHINLERKEVEEDSQPGGNQLLVLGWLRGQLRAAAAWQKAGLQELRGGSNGERGVKPVKSIWRCEIR